MSELVELNDGELDAVSGGWSLTNFGNFAPNIQTNVVAPLNIALGVGSFGAQTYNVGSTNSQSF